jgi:MFS family permease
MPPHRRFPIEDHDGLSDPLLADEYDDADGFIGVSRGACLPEEGSSSSSSSSCDLHHNQPVSRNVALIQWYTWFAFVGRGIWNQNVLSTLVFLVRSGDPKSVGYITAAMGICQLLVSIPTGILADKYRRDTLLKAAAALGVAAVVVSIWTSLRTNYVSLVIALCMWGSFFGIVDTAITALLADSVAEKRSYYFTQRSMIISLANMCGPLVALVMFAVIGDEWTIRGCSIVLLVGNLICVPAVILLCFLSDDATAQQQHNESGDQAFEQDIGCTYSDEDIEESRTVALLEQPLLWAESASPPHVNRPLCRDSPTSKSSQDDIYDEEGLGSILPCFPQQRVIAILVAMADVAAGLSSGMSIRYFAIFLYDNLKLDPVLVQVLYTVTPALQIGLQRYAQHLGDLHGRCRTTVWLKWIGILFMFSMVAAYEHGLPRWVVCAVFVLRTAFNNAPAALTKSVLMDSVPKSERAKWASLESVNMFSWSGSAFLGGILVQHYGILFNFSATAGLQFMATLPLLVLSFYGKDGEDEDTATDLVSGDDHSDGSDDRDAD